MPGRNATVVARRGGAQYVDAARLEAALGHVVADPDLEQVAEDEDRVGAGVQHVRGPGVERARRVLGQVQIGEQVDGAPVRRRNEGRRRFGGDRHGHGRRRAGAASGDAGGRGHETTVARVSVTSSSGTSAWPPRLPVRTRSIASTTSWPETTRPKTA